jgi:uncharacterized protein involved in exopolysaccharide biosynthesis
MSQRMLDLAFRHKVLLAVPVLLGFLLGIAWFIYGMKDVYVSSASIQVQRTPYTLSAVNFNPYLSAAQNQTEAMQEWLLTNDFREKAVTEINKTVGACGAAPMLPSDLLHGTSIGTGGTNNFVYLAYRSASPCVAKTVVDGLIEQYKLTFGAEVLENAESAVGILSIRLEQAREDEAEANRAYEEYLAVRPELRDIDPQRPSAGAFGDLQFATLYSELQAARSITDRTATQLAEAENDIQSTNRGESQGFQVIDEPETPMVPLALGTRAVATKPVMGLAAGLVVSAAIFFILLRRDRTVRVPSDLDFMENGAPVMTLPALRSNRRRWPQSFVRLATGLTNGLNNLG